MPVIRCDVHSVGRIRFDRDYHPPCGTVPYIVLDFTCGLILKHNIHRSEIRQKRQFNAARKCITLIPQHYNLTLFISS